MFAAIIVGALLGGGARSTIACDASYRWGRPTAGRSALMPGVSRPKTGVRKTLSADGAAGLHRHGIALPIHDHDPQ